MDNIKAEVSRRVGGKLYFDRRMFFRMLSVWLVCAVFMFFPLILRPLFIKAASSVDAAFWDMVMSDNDVLYLIAGISVVALGLAVLAGKRGSAFVYFIAVCQGIAIFLAIMGYLMLEGDPTLFKESVMRMNIGFLLTSAVLALVLFISVSFRIKGGTDKR